jgi:hypothetical protein
MCQLYLTNPGSRNTNASRGEASYAGRQARLRLSDEATDRENILTFRLSSRKCSVLYGQSTACLGTTDELSIRIIGDVFDLSLASTDKLVLLAIANYADDRGRCWPSVATLVKKTGLSERAVQGSVLKLQSGGHLEVIRMPGRSNVFVIHTPAAGAGTPARRAPPPPQQVHPTPAAGAPITVKDPSFEPSKTLKSEKPLETVVERRQAKEALHLVTRGLRDRFG